MRFRNIQKAGRGKEIKGKAENEIRPLEEKEGEGWKTGGNLEQTEENNGGRNKPQSDNYQP